MGCYPQSPSAVTPDNDASNPFQAGLWRPVLSWRRVARVGVGRTGIAQRSLGQNYFGERQLDCFHDPDRPLRVRIDSLPYSAFVDPPIGGPSSA
jgi:hypothetical protein